MFEYVENFLSPHVIAQFDKYCGLNEADESSDDVWNPAFTKYNDNETCFTQKCTDNELWLLRDDIFNNKDNPLYKNRVVRNMSCAIQKYPKGAVLQAHKDRCIGSVTIFLNKNWDINSGGMFHWIDDDAKGNGYCVLPKYNCAILKMPPKGHNNKNSLGQTHWVTEVLGNDTRSCIQIFIWGQGDANNTLNEWSSPNDVEGVIL